MSKIGIIAGGGKLPLVIGKNLIRSNHEVVFFCIDPFVNLIEYKKFNANIIKLESISKIIHLLKSNDIEQIIMAGFVKRPSLKDIKFDYNTVKLIKKFVLEPKGDDKLLSTISKFFEENNFKIFNWQDECKDLFVYNEFLTYKKPTKISIQNLNKGLQIFKTLGKVDLAQSMIIQNKLILGIEAVEGTDDLIKRCYKYKKKGDKGILLKLSKYNQNIQLDIPVIGLNTVKLLKKFDFEGVFIEKKKCVIIDKNKVIKFCNEKSLFLSGIDKI